MFALPMDKKYYNILKLSLFREENNLAKQIVISNYNQ